MVFGQLSGCFPIISHGRQKLTGWRTAAKIQKKPSSHSTGRILTAIMTGQRSRWMASPPVYRMPSTHSALNGDQIGLRGSWTARKWRNSHNPNSLLPSRCTSLSTWRSVVTGETSACRMEQRHSPVTWKWIMSGHGHSHVKRVSNRHILKTCLNFEDLSTWREDTRLNGTKGTALAKFSPFAIVINPCSI